MRIVVPMRLMFVWWSGTATAFVAGGYHHRYSHHRQPQQQQQKSSSHLLPKFGVLHQTLATATATATTTTSSASLVEEEEEKVASKPSSSKTVILANHDEFICPKNDKRKYRCLRLVNNLQVLLVSSPESDVEAGAIHVQAGHMDDPPNRPGLAHFHEHMLFLGTDKYPDENEYESFLNSHGGYSNAYTDMEETNYYFSVTPHNQGQGDDDEAEDDDDDSPDDKTTSTALTGALDRFAQFFIAPKFDVNMVDRELRAIDSEYKNALTSDAWRQYSLLKSFASKDHPFSKFGCGNYNTLTNGGNIIDDTTTDKGGTSPVNDLLKFWKTYCQTYNMKLCIVGRASLDALQKTVEDTFGHLPYSEGKPRHKHNLIESQIFPMENSNYNQVPAFGPTNELQKYRQVIPLQESRLLKIHFATPPLDDPYLKESRPYRVLSHLIGHESPGSLHEVLNEDGLLVDLSSGTGLDVSDFSLFSLTLSLTKKGMSNKQKVLDMVFQWITLIKSQSPEVLEKYHDELRQISDTHFVYNENGDPSDFCSSASQYMFHYEPKDILKGPSRTGEFDVDVCNEFMKRLTPQNCMIIEINSDLVDTNDNNDNDDDDDWQKEKWYGAKYKEHDISEETVQRWSSTDNNNIDPRLELPALNEYIPSDFTLRCDDDNNSDNNNGEGSKVNGDNDDNEAADDEEEKKKKQENYDAKEPPTLLVERPGGVRLWHKVDRTWRVPRTYIELSLLSPNVYRSPRSMTCNRIFQKVLNDDLNSFVYDASVAGCSYRVGIYDTGYRISVSGYSEKIKFLLDTLTSRMLSLIEQMKEGPDSHPLLSRMFNKAHESLLRETKNYRLDSPQEISNYNSRLLIEEDAWFLDDYVSEMEGEGAERDPLTMQECARVAEECLLGRLKAELLCMGNINKEQARDVLDVVDAHFLNSSRPLLEGEVPSYHSLKIPTQEEAVAIVGPSAADRTIPLICQEVAISESEENNAVEIVLQAGSGFELGWEGLAMLYLTSHISYNSIFNQLRTKEQLGYIVQSYTRKTIGSGWGLSLVVQSSVALPEVLEERCEAWLKLFRKELDDMDEESVAMEAAAVAAQLLERDTTLAQEVSHWWGAITMAETLGSKIRQPPFLRIDRLVQELITVGGTDDIDEQIDVAIDKNIPHKTAKGLKKKLLAFFDEHFAAGAPKRRALSSRVYNHKAKNEYEKNLHEPGVLSTYDDIRDMKQYLQSQTNVPYWIESKR